MNVRGLIELARYWADWKRYAKREVKDMLAQITYYPQGGDDDHNDKA